MSMLRRATRVALVIALVASATPLVCLAQSNATPRLMPKSPEPGSEFYPADIAASGAQGSAEVTARIAPDGLLIEPKIERSTGSLQLDELAISLAKSIKLKTNDGSAFPESVIVPVEFERDTILTIPTKTCKEFNAELAYERGRSPTASAQQVRAYRLATGMMMLLPGLPKERQLAVVRNLKTLPPLIERECAASPEAMFMDTLSKLVPAH